MAIKLSRQKVHRPLRNIDYIHDLALFMHLQKTRSEMARKPTMCDLPPRKSYRRNSTQRKSNGKW